MLRFFDRLASRFLVVLGLILIAMIGLSVWNVISRYVFNSAVLWADEVTTFAMVVLTYLGTVVCVWRGSVVRMDIVTGLLPAGAERALKIMQQIVVLGAVAWTAWLSWGYVARIFSVGMKSTSARVPLWVVNGALTVAFALLALISLARLVRLVTHGSDVLSPSALNAKAHSE